MASMTTLSSLSPQLIFFLVVFLLLTLPYSSFADPDPLQDLCVADLNGPTSFNGFPCKPASEITSDDFFLDLSKEANTSNVFNVKVTPGNVLSFPAVNTLGLSLNRMDFAPGGINPPHVHPRAAEAIIVIQGSILAGFVTTGGMYHSKVLTGGQAFVIPRGLVHFQLNVGEGKALMFFVSNGQLPGYSTLPLTLFASKPPIPNEVLTKTFQVAEDVINNIKSKFVS